MSLQLKFLPIIGNPPTCQAPSMVMLDADDDCYGEVSDQISDLEKATNRLVSDYTPYFATYLKNFDDGGACETGYGPTTTTPYGEPVRWVYAHELAAIVPASCPSGAWLKLSRPSERIALWWY